jgi:putative MATE family efflux protein
MSNPAPQEITGIFEGPVLPVTLKLGFPILLSNLFNFFYNIVDTVFISMIDRGSTALISGTGIVFPVYFLFLALASGLGVGMSTLVARSIGERNMAALRHGMASGFLLSLVIAVVTIPLGYIFGDRILALLAGKGMSREAIGYGAQYFQWVLPGLAIMVFGQVLMGILQGEGKTKHIAVAMIISTLANIGLDPLFIFTFRMGVAGAAAATTVSIAIAGVYVLFVFLSGRSSAPLNLNPFAARPAMMRQIVAIGFPQSLGMLAMSIAFMALNKLVSGIGEAEMNAWSLVGRVDQLVFIPIFAISAANTTMIGQNYGRRNLARLLKVTDMNLLASFIIILGLSVLYILGAPLLYRAFSSVDTVLSLSVTQVRWLSFTFIGVAAAIICGGTFQGTGTPLPALVITLLRIGLVSVPLSCLFVLGFGWGMPGMWAAMGVSNLMSLPLAWLWVRHHLKHLEFRSVEG